MDENAKEYLYEQLEQIVQYSVKEDKEELISKEKFMEMTGAECLRYVFEYRDNNEPYEFNGEKGEAYIQVPNIDLSNEDLNDVILRGFILSHPENDDEVISSINFANTGITLDLNSILENQTEQTGTTNKRIIDFSQCNFEGCTIYGILPDEYQSETAKITDGYEVRGRKKLGEEYIERRNQLHDVQAPKTLSRRAYERLTDGRDFSRLNGITDATEIHLEDLDFDTNDEQGLGEMYQTLYGELETRENLNGIYTNMNLSSEFIKNTFQKLTSDYAKGKFLQELVREGKELEFVFENARYIQDEETKEEVKEQALQNGISEKKIEWQLNPNGDNLLECIDEDIDFVKSEFDGLYGREDKSRVLQELVRQGKEFEFVYKNVRYIQDEETKKKVKEQALQSGISEKEIDLKFNPNVVNLLEFIDEDIDFVKEKFKELNYYGKGEVLKELIRRGKELEFVKSKYAELYEYEGRREILKELIRQGKDLDFIKSKFDEAYSYEDQRVILQELVRQGKEFKFVYKNARYIQDEETKKKVKEQALQRGISEKKIKFQLRPDGSNLLEIIDEDIDFVKSKFSKLYYDKDKAQVLKELVRQGQELDFVKKEFNKFRVRSEYEKCQVLQELVRQGQELDFVKKKFDELKGYKGLLLLELVLHGKEIDFVKKEFYWIKSEYKALILQELIRQGQELNFVKEKFKEGDFQIKRKTLQELARQGQELDFVKEKFKAIDSFGKGLVLEELAEQGQELDFVKSKFDELDDNWDKAQVLEELVRQGKEFEFAFENAIYIQDEETKKKVKEQAQQRGISEAKIEWQFNPNVDNLLECIDEDIDFVKENFESLVNKDKSQVLQELVRQGKEFEFAFENAIYIQDEETKKKVKEQAQQRGISEAKIEWQFNPNVDNLLECIDEDIDFVKENFESLANKDKNQVLQELIRRGEHQELVNEYWRYIEGNETIEINSNQFRNIIGCGEKESKELIKLMESTQINLTNLIRKKAILASCGIDIKDAVKNRTLMQTSPVVLYAKKRYYESVGQPTNISNLGMSRAKFENMSGKTLTGICNEYVFSDRYDNLKDTVVEEINKEIQEQKEKKAKQSKNMPNQQQSRIEAKSNSKAHKVNPVVSTFLQTQVGISETQEQKLGEWLQRFNYDIYSQNVEEDLALKKQILDQFGVTSQAFGMSCKILTIPLKTLYARAQFLKDIGEKVTPANLMATLGANGDIFAQKYGSYFMEEKSKQDAQYIMNVENATNENYPMPKTKEEIIRKIKEMEEKQK